MAEGKPRLRPAHVGRDRDARAFRPAARWRWALLVLGLAGGIGGAFWMRHVHQVATVRASIADLHRDAIVPAAARVEAFRAKIEGWVMEAAKAEPEAWADPSLDLAALHAAQGAYLRVPAKAAQSSDTLARAALQMGPDAITRCLGISPISLRGLYVGLGFLSPHWMTDVDRTDGLMRLRVLENQLGRHVQRDLPLLLHAIDSDYFLLVLQHGEHRAEGPVDVFLWDLRRDRPLLRARTEPRGLLLPVRVEMDGAPLSARSKADPRSAGANDCAIASQVQAVARAAGDGP
jgi:hypothetical protein